MTEKQYAAILDAIDKSKQELLLKLTEIMDEPEAEVCLYVAEKEREDAEN